MTKSAKIVVISNPTAGQRKAGFVKSVLRRLMERGHTVELRVTERPGHAVEIAREWAGKAETDLIVAAGGDGTIREIVEGLVGQDTPLGIIAAGTANVLARELGYLKNGRRSVKRTVCILEDTFSEKIHPFSVQLPHQKIVGMCWTGVGFDADVLRYVDTSLKKKVGRAAFLPAILKTLAQEPNQPVVSWEFSTGKGETDQGQCGWALVANIGKYAGAFQATRKTSLTDKGLACLLFPKAGWLARALDQLVIAFRPLDDRGATRLLEKGSLTLGSASTAVQVDGDLVGFGPVTIAPMEATLKIKAAPK